MVKRIAFEMNPYEAMFGKKIKHKCLVKGKIRVREFHFVLLLIAITPDLLWKPLG